MLAGEDEIIEAARAKMDEGDWRLSPAEWATEEVPMRFCGFEVYKKDEGYPVAAMSRWTKKGVEVVNLGNSASLRGSVHGGG